MTGDEGACWRARQRGVGGTHLPELPFTYIGLLACACMGVFHVSLEVQSVLSLDHWIDGSPAWLWCREGHGSALWGTHAAHRTFVVQHALGSALSIYTRSTCG